MNLFCFCFFDTGESLSTSHPDSFNVTTDSRNQSESGSVPASAPPESSHASSSLSIFGKDSESPTTSVNDLNVDAAEYVRRRRLERFKSNWSNISALSGSSSSDIQEWSSSGTSSFSEKLAVSSSSLQQPPHAHPLSCSFELDDMVMVERPDAAPWYGVIRWIGELPERQGVPVAGIEMVSGVFFFFAIKSNIRLLGRFSYFMYELKKAFTVIQNDNVNYYIIYQVEGCTIL